MILAEGGCKCGEIYYGRGMVVLDATDRQWLPWRRHHLLDRVSAFAVLLRTFECTLAL